ncbi:DUF2479 domain-containing protein [Bacillus sp. AFS023182]|uniref:BppU family phage baseplate upper protein n=1 Tax=Bacillus sp. AFS023182 TaxID=2033492 RepID=UPI000BF8822B|nr:BppU family phage baseplate upper protein [Bacillus sp. AFS023182]PFD98928.1 DUF2479 domain-containing protein [Bacillus sp. AFS023182]
MRSEKITIDLTNNLFTKKIYARQNDKYGLKLTVYLKENERTVDLTGYTVKYEAINNKGNFVRDDALVINSTEGIIEYTFSAAAVSSPNEWTAYFVCEKGNITERFSTPDIKIILGNDVKQGNIGIESYISDFEKALESVAGYRKEIDDTNKKIVELTNLINAKNVQVPKITTDVGGALLSVSDATKNILDEIVSRGLGINTIYCHGSVQGNTPNAKSWRGISFINSPTFGFVIAKDYQNKFFTNYIDNGTWLGWEEHVTLNDLLKTLNGWKFTTTALQLNGKSILTKIATGFLFDDNLQISGVLKQSTDTDWVNVTPINGVLNQSGKTSKIKRIGSTVCLNMNVTGVKNNQIIATLPANFRPTSDLTFSATYVLSNLDTTAGFITLKTDGSVHCEWIAEGTNPLRYWSFTLTYII